jgi:hypothetical protein
MGTFNGPGTALKFVCKDNSHHFNKEASIVIDPEKLEDMKLLSDWLVTHSYVGGTYTTVTLHKNQDLIDKMLADGWCNVGVLSEDKKSPHLHLRKNGIEVDVDNLERL